MSKIIDRILQLIEYHQDSQRDFYAKTGISNGLLNKVKTVGSDNLEKIYYAYPNLSLEWLLLGKGEMLIIKRYPVGEVMEPEVSYLTAEKSTLQNLQDLVNYQRLEIESLKRQLESGNEKK